ncbi:RWD domain-containing protein 1 [Lingula anatina]|uniref:RWD domain-containing protein 1 n=1 Tax=Lingula anatina TaxID=7574 RepID=A0A1S3HB42_LINAN|nr:RWD domain-containing protein 1 [Lingula anatina]|eukprot:XP_013383262.1 RWD domain-containing protein 1 [Lingula anatina]
MTDYKEEQDNEIEALESIYPDEIKVLSTEPYTFTVDINITDSPNENHEDESVSITVQFTYTPSYPDEGPLIEIVNANNLDDQETDSLLQFMQSQVEENLGMVMVFSIVSATQEKLTEMREERKKRKEEERERKARELEELEQKKFEGTKVTIETFLAWKTAFDAELAEAKRKAGLQREVSKKLTGRELFMRDSTMDDSDIKFLEGEEGDAVEVDESLFEDLDDLDIDEDEDVTT